MSNGHLWTETILSLLFMAATDRLCDKLRLIELETTKVQQAGNVAGVGGFDADTACQITVETFA